MRKNPAFPLFVGGPARETVRAEAEANSRTLRAELELMIREAMASRALKRSGEVTPAQVAARMEPHRFAGISTPAPLVVDPPASRLVPGRGARPHLPKPPAAQVAKETKSKEPHADLNRDLLAGEPSPGVASLLASIKEPEVVVEKVGGPKMSPTDRLNALEEKLNAGADPDELDDMPPLAPGQVQITVKPSPAEKLKPRIGDGR